MENTILLCIASGLLGLFIMSILAVGLDFGCEVSYPMPANSVTGTMLAYSQLLATVQIIAASLILKRGTDMGGRQFRAIMVLGIFIISVTVATVCAAFVKQDLRKTRMDSQAEEVSESERSTFAKSAASFPSHES